jgi:hypothetical protein
MTDVLFAAGLTILPTLSPAPVIEGVMRCPLLALSRHSTDTLECLLLGAKRTWLFRCEMSAFDPKRTVLSSSNIPI